MYALRLNHSEPDSSYCNKQDRAGQEHILGHLLERGLVPLHLPLLRIQPLMVSPARCFTSRVVFFFICRIIVKIGRHVIITIAASVPLVSVLACFFLEECLADLLSVVRIIWLTWVPIDVYFVHILAILGGEVVRTQTNRSMIIFDCRLLPFLTRSSPAFSCSSTLHIINNYSGLTAFALNE